LRSASSASNATSRFRSTDAKFTLPITLMATKHFRSACGGPHHRCCGLQHLCERMRMNYDQKTAVALRRLRSRSPRLNSRVRERLEQADRVF
jgi:hypothetical protein